MTEILIDEACRIYILLTSINCSIDPDSTKCNYEEKKKKIDACKFSVEPSDLFKCKDKKDLSINNPDLRDYDLHGTKR